MNRYLANALRDPAEPWIPDLFYPGFHTAQQWRQFIEDRFPDGVESILGKTRNRDWSKHDFQALYVACWIYKPVVKGSYMLKLFEEHETGVRKAYKKKLSTRWTSHLHGPVTKGANASKGWRFLKGYHELLIQFEDAPDGKYLFLKCEGHPAISYAHIKSWKHKKKTGQGLDVNVELLTKASDEDLNLGIKVRAAENYSTAYRDLLRTLGLQKYMKKQGEIIHTRQAAALLINEGRKLAEHHRPLAGWLRAALIRDMFFTVGPLPEDYFDDEGNYRVANAFDLLANLAEQVGPGTRRNAFFAALINARSDLRSIARSLRKDVQRGNLSTVRYFQEVVVHPYDVNYGLNKALALLSQPKEDL